MKFSFSTCVYSSSPFWLPAYPIEYIIPKLSEIGYDGIELLCASPVAYPQYMKAKDRERVIGLLEQNRIVVSSVLPNPGGGCGNNVASPLEEERLQAIQSYKDSIDLGYDLGAKICLYVAGWVIWGVGQDQAWEWSRECLIEIAKYARSKGMMMAIEPTPSEGNLIETADDAIRLMRETALENVKVMFDTFHAFYRGDSITDYVDKMGSDLIHVHISDIDRMPPGTHNDFRDLTKALKSANYAGFLTMEVGIGSQGRKVDANFFARKSLDYFRSIM